MRDKVVASRYGDGLLQIQAENIHGLDTLDLARYQLSSNNRRRSVGRDDVACLVDSCFDAGYFVGEF